jgi:hypothetical protein
MSGWAGINAQMRQTQGNAVAPPYESFIFQPLIHTRIHMFAASFIAGSPHCRAEEKMTHRGSPENSANDLL